MFMGDPLLCDGVAQLPRACHGNAAHMWERGFSFIKRAGTIILLSAIVIWFMKSYGVVDGRLAMVEDMDHSVLAWLGAWSLPVCALLWQLAKHRRYCAGSCRQRRSSACLACLRRAKARWTSWKRARLLIWRRLPRTSRSCLPSPSWPSTCCARPALPPLAPCTEIEQHQVDRFRGGLPDRAGLHCFLIIYQLGILPQGGFTVDHCHPASASHPLLAVSQTPPR